MKATLSALATVLLLAGCASTQPPVSTLQRYDRMKRQLHWLTTRSERLSSETLSLGQVVSRADVPRTRRLARRLKTAANRFTRYAGRVGNTIRTLSIQSLSLAARRYLGFIADVLTWDWVEGTALQRVCDQLWRDPLSATGSGAERLYKDVRWARTAAGRAARFARLAAEVRRQAPAALAYTIETSTH